MYKVASGKNWFTIFPRGLTIASFHEPLHWYQKTLTGKDGRIQITIGKLRNICWLDVSGKFQTVTLSQGIKYEIVLHVKSVDAEIVKFDAPVSFKITLPDGCKVDGERNFKELLKGGSWKDISLHEFMMTTENVGELQFCIYEHGGTWKSEIELGGISFKPKTTITPRPSNRQQQNVDAQQQQQNVDTQQQQQNLDAQQQQQQHAAQPSSEDLPAQHTAQPSSEDPPAQHAAQPSSEYPPAHGVPLLEAFYD
ncbi:hypothetical protein CDL15_Pgr027258 [Punica granatum]|uniref:Uncharacterized protein n=1 Tax=Punica granatum TaxID=22663 RepID=A0A218XP29_PUNGR|nr:hypothetical protein CDL15_Pgr027258 [Punica granatum]